MRKVEGHAPYGAVQRRAMPAAVLVMLAVSSGAQEGGVGFAWEAGPTVGRLGSHAVIDVPEGYVFLGRSETIRLLEFMQNPTSGMELGTLAPASEEEDWLLFFEFDDVGYVEDDEKDELDADALLESIRAGNDVANQTRRDRGWSTLQIDGWQMKPRYNETTNNLEWAIRASSEGMDVLNHDIRLLGRYGVMQVSLVSGPEGNDAAVAAVDSLLTGFSFENGKRYDEYRSGDKLAEYGLTALVTGGAAAVALKTGLLKKFWKVIVLVLVALASFAKKVWRRITGGPTHEAMPSSGDE